MNNKPVAWMVDTVITYSDDIAQGLANESGKLIIPLYTHPAPTKVKFASDSCESGWIYLENAYPVKDKPHPKCDEACMYLCKMRELTDEEITKLWLKCWDEIEFARAILRKAQEK